MKFMLSLNGRIGESLKQIAEERRISVQELLRTMVIPDWIRGYTDRVVIERRVIQKSDVMRETR